MKTYADIVNDLIIPRIRRRNPVVGGVIVQDLGLINATPTVLVLTGGATRQAAYLAPIALQVPGNCFVCRASHELTAPLIIPLSNFQVAVTGLGLGSGGLGTAPLGT